MDDEKNTKRLKSIERLKHLKDLKCREEEKNENFNVKEVEGEQFAESNDHHSDSVCDRSTETKGDNENSVEDAESNQNESFILIGQNGRDCNGAENTKSIQNKSLLLNDQNGRESNGVEDIEHNGNEPFALNDQNGREWHGFGDNEINGNDSPMPTDQNGRECNGAEDTQRNGNESLIINNQNGKECNDVEDAQSNGNDESLIINDQNGKEWNDVEDTQSNGNEDSLMQTDQNGRDCNGVEDTKRNGNESLMIKDLNGKECNDVEDTKSNENESLMINDQNGKECRGVVDTEIDGNDSLMQNGRECNNVEDTQSNGNDESLMINDQNGKECRGVVDTEIDGDDSLMQNGRECNDVENTQSNINDESLMINDQNGKEGRGVVDTEIDGNDSLMQNGRECNDVEDTQSNRNDESLMINDQNGKEGRGVVDTEIDGNDSLMQNGRECNDVEETQSNGNESLMINDQNGKECRGVVDTEIDGNDSLMQNGRECNDVEDTQSNRNDESLMINDQNGKECRSVVDTEIDRDDSLMQNGRECNDVEETQSNGNESLMINDQNGKECRGVVDNEIDGNDSLMHTDQNGRECNGVEDTQRNGNESLMLNDQNGRECLGVVDTEINGNESNLNESLMLNGQNDKEFHSVGHTGRNKNKPNIVNHPRNKGCQIENDLVNVEDDKTNQNKLFTVTNKRDSGCQREPSSVQTDWNSEQSPNSSCPRASTSKSDSSDGNHQNLDKLKLNKDILDQMIIGYLNFNKKDVKFVELLQKFVIHMRKHRLIAESSHSKTLCLNTSCQTSGEIDVFARPLKKLLGPEITSLGPRKRDLKSEILFNLENMPEGTTFEICARIILNHSPLEVRHLFNSLYRRVQNELNEDQETFHSVTESWGENKEVTRYSLGWPDSDEDGESGSCSEVEDEDTNKSDQHNRNNYEKVENTTTNLGSDLRGDPAYLDLPTSASRQDQQIRPPPQRIYCCVICDLETPSKEELKRHVIFAHSNKPFYVNKADPNLNSRYNKYNCAKCNFETKSKAMIYRHVKYIHPVVNTRRSKRRVLKSNKNRTKPPKINSQPSNDQSDEISNQLLPAPASNHSLNITSAKRNDQDETNRNKISTMAIDLNDGQTTGQDKRLNETGNNAGQTEISIYESDNTELTETGNNTGQTETSNNIGPNKVSNNTGHVEISNNTSNNTGLTELNNNTRETQTEVIEREVEIFRQMPSTSGTYLFLPYTLTEINTEVSGVVEINSEVTGVVEIGEEVTGVIEIGEEVTSTYTIDQEVAEVIEIGEEVTGTFEIDPGVAGVAEIDPDVVQTSETLQITSSYESNDVSSFAIENDAQFANFVDMNSDLVRRTDKIETTSISGLNNLSRLVEENYLEVANFVEIDLDSELTSDTIETTSISELDNLSCIDIKNYLNRASKIDSSLSISEPNILPPLETENYLNVANIVEIDSDSIATSNLGQNTSVSQSNSLSHLKIENLAMETSSVADIDSSFASSISASKLNVLSQLSTENSNVAATTDIDSQYAESASVSESNEQPNLTENSELVLYSARTTSASESDNHPPQLSPENLIHEGIFKFNSAYAESPSTSRMNDSSLLPTENPEVSGITNNEDVQTTSISELNDTSLLRSENPEVTDISNNSDVQTITISEFNGSFLLPTENQEVTGITNNEDVQISELNDTSLLRSENPEVTGISNNSDVQTITISEFNGSLLLPTENQEVTGITNNEDVQTTTISELNDLFLLPTENPKVTGITNNSKKETSISKLSETSTLLTESPEVIGIINNAEVQSSSISELNDESLLPTDNLEVTGITNNADVQTPSISELNDESLLPTDNLEVTGITNIADVQTISTSETKDLSLLPTENLEVTGISNIFDLQTTINSESNDLSVLPTVNLKISGIANNSDIETNSIYKLNDLSTENPEITINSNNSDVQTTTVSELNGLFLLPTENPEVTGISNNFNVLKTTFSELNDLSLFPSENPEIAGITNNSNLHTTTISKLNDLCLLPSENNDVIGITNNEDAQTSLISDLSLLPTETPEITGIANNSDVQTTSISDLNDSSLFVTQTPQVKGIIDIDESDQPSRTIQSVFTSETNDMELSEADNIALELDQGSESMPSLDLNTPPDTNVNNNLGDEDPTITYEFKEDSLKIKFSTPICHDELFIDLSCNAYVHVWVNNVELVSILLSEEGISLLRSLLKPSGSRFGSSNCNNASSSRNTKNYTVEPEEELFEDINDFDESHWEKAKESFKAKFEDLIKHCQESTFNSDKDDDETSESSFYSDTCNICDVFDYETDEFDEYETMLDSDYESDDDQAFYYYGSTKDLNNYETLLFEQFQFRSDSEVMMSDETFDQDMQDMLDISHANIDVNALLDEFHLLFIIRAQLASFIDNHKNYCNGNHHIKYYIYECNHFAIRYNDLLNTFKPFNIFIRHYGLVATNVYKIVRFSFAFAILFSNKCYWDSVVKKNIRRIERMKKKNFRASNNMDQVNRSKKDPGERVINPSENMASTSNSCHPSIKINRIPPKKNGKDPKVTVADGYQSHFRNLGRDFFDECFGMGIPCSRGDSKGCRRLNKEHHSNETHVKRQDSEPDENNSEQVRILRSGSKLNRTKLSHKYDKVSFRSDHLQNEDDDKASTSECFPEDSNSFNCSSLVVDDLGSDDEIDVLQKKYLDEVSKPQMTKRNQSRCRNRRLEDNNKNRQSDDGGVVPPTSSTKHKINNQVKSSEFWSLRLRDRLKAHVSPSTVDQDVSQAGVHEAVAKDPENDTDERAGIECSFREYLKGLKRLYKSNRDESTKDEIPYEEDCTNVAGPSGIKRKQDCNCNEDENIKDDEKCSYCSRSFCSVQSHMDCFMHDSDREIILYKNIRRRKKLCRLLEEYSFQYFLKISLTTIRVMVRLTERFIHKFFKRSAGSKEVPDLNYRILEIMSLRLIKMTLCFRGFSRIIKEDYWETFYRSDEVVKCDMPTEENDDKSLPNDKNKHDKKKKKHSKRSEKLKEKKKTKAERKKEKRKKKRKKKAPQKVDYLSDNAVDMDGQLELSNNPDVDLKSFHENSNFEQGEPSVISCSDQGIKTHNPEDSEQLEDIPLHDVQFSQKCDEVLSDDSNSTWENENKKRMIKKNKTIQAKKIKTRISVSKNKLGSRSKYRKRSRDESLNSQDEMKIIKKRKRTKSITGDSDSRDPTFKPTNVKQTNINNNQPDNSKLKCLRTRKVTSYNLMEKDYLEDIIGKMEDVPTGSKSLGSLENIIDTKNNKPAGGKRGRPRKTEVQPVLRHGTLEKEDDSKRRRLRSRTNNDPNVGLALDYIQYLPSARQCIDENRLLNVQLLYDEILGVKDESQPPTLIADIENAISNKSKRGRKPKSKKCNQDQQSVKNNYQPAGKDDQSMDTDKMSVDHQSEDCVQHSVNVDHIISVGNNQEPIDDQKPSVGNQQHSVVEQPQHPVGDQPDVINDQQQDAVDCQQPDVVDGQQPDAVDGQQPDDVDGQQPDAVDCQQPDVVDGQQKDAVDGQQPDVVDGQQPDDVDGQQQDVVDGQQPDVVDGQQPYVVDGQQPDVVDNQENPVVNYKQQPVIDNDNISVNTNHSYAITSEDNIQWRSYQSLTFPSLDNNKSETTIPSTDFKNWTELFKNRKQLEVQLINSLTNQKETFKLADEPSQLGHKSIVKRKDANFIQAPCAELLRRDKAVRRQPFLAPTQFICNTEIKGPYPIVAEHMAKYRSKRQSLKLTEQLPNSTTICLSTNSPVLPTKTRINREIISPIDQSNTSMTPAEIYNEDLLPIDLSTKSVTPTTNQIKRDINTPTDQSNTSLTKTPSKIKDVTTPTDPSNISVAPTITIIKRDVTTPNDLSSISVTSTATGINKHLKSSSDLTNRLIPPPTTTGINRPTMEFTDQSNRSISSIKIENSRQALEPIDISNRTVTPTATEVIIPDVADTDQSNISVLTLRDLSITPITLETPVNNRSGLPSTNISHRSDLSPTDLSIIPIIPVINSLALTSIDKSNRSGIGSNNKISTRSVLPPTGLSHSEVPPTKSGNIGQVILPTDLSNKPVLPSTQINNRPAQVPNDTSCRESISTLTQSRGKSVSTPTDLTPPVLSLKVVVNGSCALPPDTSNQSISKPSEIHPFQSPTFDNRTFNLHYAQLLNGKRDFMLRQNASSLHLNYPQLPLYGRSLMSNLINHQSTSFLRNVASHPRLTFPPMLHDKPLATDNLNTPSSNPQPSITSNNNLLTHLNNNYPMDYDKPLKHFCIWCSKAYTPDLLNLYYARKVNVCTDYLNCFLCERNKDSREPPNNKELVYTKLHEAQNQTSDSSVFNLSSQTKPSDRKGKKYFKK